MAPPEPALESPADTTGISRRRLLVGGLGLTVLAGVGLGTSGVADNLIGAMPWANRDPEPLARTPLSTRVGSRFVTRDGDQQVVLTLSQIDDLPAPNATDNPEGQFIARFTGPADHPLAQNTYRFATNDFGEVDIFVVPVPGMNVATYDAVFNRLPEFELGNS